jgi:1,4-dihydroxy-2-naphthoate octaprenyltransferase
LLAARPKTLIAGISPVAIGASLAQGEGSLFILLSCFLLALLLQIAANFANDYFDALRGVDTPNRIGPPRAVASGWLSPSAVLNALRALLVAASLVGLYLVSESNILWIIPLAGAVAGILLYSGGSRPYASLGLGELVVFLFFGPIPTCGTHFLLTHACPPPVLLASLAPGALAAALLLANNLRDQKSDAAAGKKTLVVRWGQKGGALLFALCFALALCVPLLLIRFYHYPFSLSLAAPLLFLAIPLIRTAFVAQEPETLAPLLPRTAQIFFLYTLLFCHGAL